MKNKKQPPGKKSAFRQLVADARAQKTSINGNDAKICSGILIDFIRI